MAVLVGRTTPAVIVSRRLQVKAFVRARTVNVLSAVKLRPGVGVKTYAPASQPPPGRTAGQLWPR